MAQHNYFHASTYLHTAFYSTSVCPSAPDFKPPELDKLEIELCEGPYEILSVGQRRFLRAENLWSGEVKYIEFDFQITSIRAVAERLIGDWEKSNKEHAQFRAMFALESYIIQLAEAGELRREAETAWQRYLKLKELALRPGTKGEGVAAAKAALKKAMELAL